MLIITITWFLATFDFRATVDIARAAIPPSFVFTKGTMPSKFTI
jgi:hypothetical protein